MKEATMLFRTDDAEGAQAETIWGIPLFTKTVDAHEVEDHLDAGWHRHPFEARDAAKAEANDKVVAAMEGMYHDVVGTAPSEELTLEQRAAAVGLKVDGRWSQEKLAEKVAEAEASAKAKE